MNPSEVAKWLVVCVTTVGASEGLRLYTYPDVIGVPTYCYGETQGAKWGNTYTPEQCNAKLSARQKEFDRGVSACIQHALPDHRRAAYVSLAYNIGVPSFCASTLVKKENASDIQGACAQMLLWNKANGVVWPGLTARRERERDLCLQDRS